ncbi:MAG: hypothetical protein QFX35_00680 [Candidatus Verstraetearchaeota archaeon]|nr:hypothetical protein [Candidatus Verstraetearchaeota archaeon]
MSEELKRQIEELVYSWVKKQLEDGNCTMNLRIEVDAPLELKGMRGRVCGEILLGGTQSVAVPPKADSESKAQCGEMSLQEVEKLLKSLGV